MQDQERSTSRSRHDQGSSRALPGGVDGGDEPLHQTKERSQPGAAPVTEFEPDAGTATYKWFGMDVPAVYFTDRFGSRWARCAARVSC